MPVAEALEDFLAADTEAEALEEANSGTATFRAAVAILEARNGTEKSNNKRVILIGIKTALIYVKITGLGGCWLPPPAVTISTGMSSHVDRAFLFFFTSPLLDFLTEALDVSGTSTDCMARAASRTASLASVSSS